jgi:hypothetical protein
MISLAVTLIYFSDGLTISLAFCCLTPSSVKWFQCNFQTFIN